MEKTNATILTPGTHRRTSMDRRRPQYRHRHDSSHVVFRRALTTARFLLLVSVVLVTWVVMVAPTTVCAETDSTTSTTTTTDRRSHLVQSPSPAHHVEPFMDWFLSQEGAFYDSTRQAITTTTQSNDDSRWYSVATHDIEKGAVLAMIPTRSVLTGRPQDNDNIKEEEDDNDDDEEDPTYGQSQQVPVDCTTMNAIAKELLLGHDSKFAPYLQHLQHQQSLKVPSQYSQQGKELFWEVLESENQVMLMEPTVPYEVREGVPHVCETMYRAHEENAEVPGSGAHAAARWVQQQFAVPLDSSFDAMIPLVDLYPHRNGNFTNVELQIIHHDEQHQQQQHFARLIALRDIVKGERLHTSLNECSTCRFWQEERDEVGYGTPGM
jgi:hypothetical protein